MFKVGEVIRPRKGQTPLRAGHYQVTAVLDTSVHLIRLPRKPTTKRKKITYTIFVSREMMKMFECV